MNIVIIGIGQTLRGDDGAGPAAVKAWEDRYSHTDEIVQIRTEIEELPGLNLLSLLEGTDAAIIVDAVQSHQKPGMLHLFQNTLQNQYHEQVNSAHNLGVHETLALARLLQIENLPEKITIIGIEVDNVELGEKLSSDVQKAIPKAADVIEEQFQSFLRPNLRHSQ